MTHPNTKKLYEVLDECFLVFHPRTKRRVFELFFLNEMSRRTDTHCQQGKKHGATYPPPPQKNVSKTTTTNRLYGFKKKSGRFFFPTVYFG
jgi:hypothetical protein